MGGIIIKKRITVIITILIISCFTINFSYALWNHNAEVKFKLTISKPEYDDNDCICGKYSTIQEGIDLLKYTQFNKFYNRMDRFKSTLQARISQLNGLPFGGITYDELSTECNNYRNVDIAAFGNTINVYGTCINNLATFYRNSPQSEKDKVPDFWTQYNNLWSLSNQLWSKRQELYDMVNQVWSAGEAKIDYNKGKKK